MKAIARKVKARAISSDEIAKLVEFTKQNGGIDYAEKRMWYFHSECMNFLDCKVYDEQIRKSLMAYIDYVIKRKL